MFAPLRKPLALAAVLAAGGLTALSVVSPAAASHPGSASGLTSSNGSKSISVSGSAAINARRCWYTADPFCTDASVNDAAWSPDGSRAVFINQFKDVQTVRWSNGADHWYVTWGDTTGDGNADVYNRAHPTYRGPMASSVVFAEQKTAGSHWALMGAGSSGTLYPYQITPSDSYDYVHPDGGPDGRIVFERKSGSTSEIYIWDGEGTGVDFHATKIADGSQPAISPDGEKVAYVGADGHIWTANTEGPASPVAVTTDASGTPFANPTWSADAATIAFGKTADSTVRKVAAAGGNSDPVAGLTGKPAYRSSYPNVAVRLSGSGRFETAAAVSQAFWPDSGHEDSAKSVVLSRSDMFADALGGSALAAAKQGPLLLTEPTKLTAATAAEILRVLGDSDGKVYLLGSAGAISAGVEQSVKDLGYETVRVAGPDRFATSIAIANAINPNPTYILAATGMNFPDALGAGAAAGSYNYPGSAQNGVVVLTDDAKLPPATLNYLNAHPKSPNTHIYGIGKQAAAAVGDRGDFPIYGDDRYETASAVADTFFGGHHFAGVATGTNFPDALAGGALMAQLNGPLLLTPGTGTLPESTTWSLGDNNASIDTVLVFGGPSVVSDSLLTQAGNWISGPEGFELALNPTAVAPNGIRSLGAGSAPLRPGSAPHRTAAEIAAAAAITGKRN